MEGYAVPLTLNQRVEGSIPAALTKKTANKSMEFCPIDARAVCLETTSWAQFWALFVFRTPRNSMGGQSGKPGCQVNRAAGVFTTG